MPLVKRETAESLAFGAAIVSGVGAFDPPFILDFSESWAFPVWWKIIVFFIFLLFLSLLLLYAFPLARIRQWSLWGKRQSSDPPGDALEKSYVYYAVECAIVCTICAIVSLFLKPSLMAHLTIKTFFAVLLTTVGIAELVYPIGLLIVIGAARQRDRQKAC